MENQEPATLGALRSPCIPCADIEHAATAQHRSGLGLRGQKRDRRGKGDGQRGQPAPTRKEQQRYPPCARVLLRKEPRPERERATAKATIERTVPKSTWANFRPASRSEAKLPMRAQPRARAWVWKMPMKRSAGTFDGADTVSEVPGGLQRSAEASERRQHKSQNAPSVVLAHPRGPLLRRAWGNSSTAVGTCSLCRRTS